jgi:aspartyl protease family protein
MTLIRILTLSFLLIVSLLHSPASNAASEPRVMVNALLSKAAIVTINGRQQMVKLKQLTLEGYRLLELKDNGVILEVNGKPKLYKLGVSIGPSRATGSARETIARDSNGMYRVDGVINGASVTFLVDTGATFVAINSQVAEAADIDYRRFGKPTMASTASGMVVAYRVKLNEVSVGSIKLNMIDAMVLEGSFPVIPLLGMSFLSQVKMLDKGVMLTLEQR